MTNDDDHLRNHGFLYDGDGWRLSPLYDVVPKPQIGFERRLVLGVGPQGRDATLVNAIAGAPDFDLSLEEAEAVTAELAGTVANGWEKAFREASINAADIARFATCFREAQAS